MNQRFGLILMMLVCLPASGLRADALASFARKAEMNPDDPAAQFNYAVKARQAKDLKAALKAATRVTKLTPKDAVAWELRGTVQLESNDEAGAAESFQHAVDIDGHRAGAWAGLAKIYASHEDKVSLNKALDAYRGAAKNNPKNVKLVLNQGVILSKLGDESRAISAFEKAADMEGGKVAAARYLCQLYNMSGDSKKAQAACAIAVKAEDASAETHYYLGYAENRLGRREEAAKSFAAAIKIDPKFAPALYSLGYAEYESGKLEPALARFRAAVAAKEGDYPEAQFNIAVVLGDLGRWNEAAEIYRKLLRADPKNEDAQANLDYVVETGSEALLGKGKDAYENGDFDAASKAWKAVLELDQDNSTAQEFLAKVKVKATKQSTAQQALRKAARKAVASKLKSQDEKVLKDGLAAAKAGKVGDAVRLLDFYVKKNPSNKTAIQALYKAKAEQRQQVDDLLARAGRELVDGRKAGAKALIQSALQADPGNARANKMLAAVEGHQSASKTSAESIKKLYFSGVDAYLEGDLPKAIGIWKKILAEDPGHLDSRRSLSQAEVELAALQKKK